MRCVETLGFEDHGYVWRCVDCTVAWRENVKQVNTRVGTAMVGAWCRLDYHTWTPLGHMPSGPFYCLGRFDEVSFDDYRDHGLASFHGNAQREFEVRDRQANTQLLGWPGPNE